MLCKVVTTGPSMFRQSKEKTQLLAMPSRYKNRYYSPTHPNRPDQLVDDDHIKEYDPSMSFRQLAVLAHTRGVLGRGCKRANKLLSKKSGIKHGAFKDTVVLWGDEGNFQNPPIEVCTNCAFVGGIKNSCGAVPVVRNSFNILLDLD